MFFVRFIFKLYLFFKMFESFIKFDKSGIYTRTQKLAKHEEIKLKFICVNLL